MPTHEELTQFLREFRALPPDKQEQFLKAVAKMVSDLRAGQPFRPSLRVKAVQGHTTIFEMTWEKHDGRATFAFGAEVRPGQPHIIWRRIGGHEIFQDP